MTTVGLLCQPRHVTIEFRRGLNLIGRAKNRRVLQGGLENTLRKRNLWQSRFILGHCRSLNAVKWMILLRLSIPLNFFVGKLVFDTGICGR
jgi:hypothetical protein